MASPSQSSKAPAFTIVIHEKGGAERREVFESSELTVGRVQGNDIMLPKGNVSKRHARLLYRDGRFIVTDLNSTNGTYVNRRRIAQATIVREGDRIYVGDFVLRVEPPADREGSISYETSSAGTRVSNTSHPEAASSETAAPTPSAIPSEVPGRPTSVSIDVATPAASTRNTLDEGFGEATALHELVGELVGKVAERFTPGELDRVADNALRQRVDPLIHEVWAGLERDAGSLDAERVFNAARAELLDFGPLGEFLKDSAVAEVGVQRFDRVTVVRSGRAAIVEPGFSSDAALKWTVHRLCEQSGTPLRADESIVERKLADGLSLRAVMGPAAPNGTLLSLRRARRATLTLEELVRRGTVSRGMATLLQHVIAARINVLVVGPRDGGTQVLLGALALAAVEGAPVWVSDSGTPPFSAMASLDPGQPLERLRKAVDVASRLPGARLVADLTTPTLASAVIECIAEGADGIVASRAAPTLERGLARLAAELVVVSPLLTGLATRDLVASAFDLVVEVVQLRDGRYRVLRIAEIVGVSGDAIQTSDIFNFLVDRTVAGGAIEGTFTPSGTVPRIAETLKARGTPLEAA
ncbi:MAG TPA: FHA domain-containing protein, partial [Polyangiaceae bacterium]|nr:FHA domain-containing protein [Polyangiaceae bacterium]